MALLCLVVESLFGRGSLCVEELVYLSVIRYAVVIGVIMGSGYQSVTSPSAHNSQHITHPCGIDWTMCACLSRSISYPLVGACVPLFMWHFI